MLFDTHAHMDDHAFDEDRKELLENLPNQGIRLLMSGLGILIVVIGLKEGFDRLREKKQLEAPDDPNIIDVEKL